MRNPEWYRLRKDEQKRHAHDYYLAHREQIRKRSREYDKTHRVALNRTRNKRRILLREERFGVKYPKETLCDICGKLISGQRIALDHDHKTGKFRGWLCKVCNPFLGYYEAHKEEIQRYLNGFKVAQVIRNLPAQELGAT